jgi:hypothetical protein
LIERVVLVHRLREVSSLTGFTRIDAPFDDEFQTQTVRLAEKPPKWLPVAVVRGEGIFIQLRETVLDKWIAANLPLDTAFLEAHQNWRLARDKDDPSAYYPGLRYVLLHTLAHALMRQVSLDAGYSMSSIRERLYSAGADGEAPAMAGILLMTSAPDSEGTLGGLVAQGYPTPLKSHLDRAIAAAALCSADPFCAEHPLTEDTLALHGAACHACLFAPETSCERGNRYLDRAVLTTLQAVRNPAAPFFAATL